jgi:hypothetical protein
MYGPGFSPSLSYFCHPERSEGSAFRLPRMPGHKIDLTDSPEVRE